MKKKIEVLRSWARTGILHVDRADLRGDFRGDVDVTRFQGFPQLRLFSHAEDDACNKRARQDEGWQEQGKKGGAPINESKSSNNRQGPRRLRSSLIRQSLKGHWAWLVTTGVDQK